MSAKSRAPEKEESLEVPAGSVDEPAAGRSEGLDPEQLSAMPDAASEPPPEVPADFASPAKPRAPAEPNLPEKVAEEFADRIVDRVNEVEAEREQSRCFQQDELWENYRKVVLATSPPTEHDLDRLVDICAELGITSDQVRRDVEIGLKARRIEDLISHSEEYNKAAVEKRAVREQVKGENEERLKKANDDLWHFENLSRQATLDRDTLNNLARERPELFDLSVRPPRLLSPGPR